MIMDIKKSVFVVATVLTIAGASPAIANAQTEIQPALEGVTKVLPVHFDVYKNNLGEAQVTLSNGEFRQSPRGGMEIINHEGRMVESLPQSLGTFTLSNPSSLLVASSTHEYAQKGFCPLGHSNGRCRGGAVAEQAVDGALVGTVAGAIGGCAAGLVATPAGCAMGAATGAIGGGVTGAVTNVLNNAKK